MVKGDPRFYSNVLMPAAQLAVRDAEDAHNWAVWALKKGLVPKERTKDTSGHQQPYVDMVSVASIYVAQMLECLHMVML